VAHAADHRQGAGGNRPGQRLVVEGPEVVETAAAAYQQDEIDFAPRLRALQGGEQLAGRRGPCTLAG
jgi:hypothetical protein